VNCSASAVALSGLQYNLSYQLNRHLPAISNQLPIGRGFEVCARVAGKLSEAEFNPALFQPLLDLVFQEGNHSRRETTADRLKLGRRCSLGHALLPDNYVHPNDPPKRSHSNPEPTIRRP
jgi:hypothetical protein